MNAVTGSAGESEALARSRGAQTGGNPHVLPRVFRKALQLQLRRFTTDGILPAGIYPELKNFRRLTRSPQDSNQDRCSPPPQDAHVFQAIAIEIRTKHRTL